MAWHGMASLRMIFQGQQGSTGQYRAIPCGIIVSTGTQEDRSNSFDDVP